MANSKFMQNLRAADGEGDAHTIETLLDGKAGMEEDDDDMPAVAVTEQQPAPSFTAPVEIPEPTVRRRGRPPVTDVREVTAPPAQTAPSPEVPPEPVPVSAPATVVQTAASSSTAPAAPATMGRSGPYMSSMGGDVAALVLDHVCKSTIANLMETHSSKIYTNEYMRTMFQGYLDGKKNSADPLFRQLVVECLDDGDTDPYLKELTKIVLEWIRDH